ncbi:uncharacterized protein LOC113378628 isoform X3 [Ctenocephalides felis]|uniref:uncharacterized protein LOC113378628 isoform X3 n=1 Tax=Ctenocephalides felis TaxID=7515 RepID=UPI000E6E467D|nr:uncharacterized protein LOC113378628 isoform X3 [Ctenocephalides felis]
MLAIILMCMMKIVEFGSGLISSVSCVEGKQLQIKKKQHRQRQKQRRTRKHGILHRGMHERKHQQESPDSDCNSNHKLSHVPCFTTGSTYGSITSSQDFTHDNSDYQWFLDYGYREPGNHQHPVSVLSSLANSYTGIDSLGYYDVISKNLDANLAEADMESFRTEDIHSLLTHMPTMCSDMQMQQEPERRGEMFASITGSTLDKIDLDVSIGARSNSQCDDLSASVRDNMSITKSELLFSPVKETPILDVNFSVDSLDMLSEQDLILTCQANKNNYTIAFEGSMTMYSEESEYSELEKENSVKKQNVSKTTNSVCSSMGSELGYTTWSQLKKRSSEMLLLRHHNMSCDDTSLGNNHSMINVHKSRSMPNLTEGGCSSIVRKRSRRNIAKARNLFLNSKLPLHTRDSKLFNASGSLSSDMGGSNNTTGGGQNVLNKPNHYFNLVQLFMKQRSISNERMSICMDQSSECWGASNSEGDSGESYANENAYRQNSPDVKILNTNNRLISIQNNTNNVGDTELKTLSKNTAVKSIFNENNLTQTNCKESKHLFNVNNNNSFEHIVCNNHKNRFGRLYNASGSVSSNGSVSVLSCSSSEGTQNTKIPQINCLSKITNRTHCQAAAAIDCSVQTSFLANSLRRHCDKSSQISDFMKVIEPSFLSKLKNNDKQIPIYVIYPSYTLPNLNFLHTNSDCSKMLLYPLKYKKFSQADKNVSFAHRRPLSCNDVEALRKTGFGHIRDWDSLTMLLPCEYRKILVDIPELSEHMKDKKEDFLKAEEKPLFCVSPPARHKQRPLSCDGNVLTGNHITNVSSSSSTATQPSSGYRGSSTILTDSSSQNSPSCNTNVNPSFAYHYDNSSTEAMHEHHRHISGIHENMPDISEASPPRPPLPRGLNRTSSNTKYPSIIQKRFSACDVIPDNIECSNMDKASKRISLDDPYQLLKQYQENTKESKCNNSIITNARRQKKYAESLNYLQYLAMNNKNECYKDDSVELKTNNAENDLNNLTKKTFAHLKSNDLTVNQIKGSHLETPPNSPNVSAIVNRLSYAKNGRVVSGNKDTNAPADNQSEKPLSGINKKLVLVSTVTNAVEKIIQHFSTATNETELKVLGDSSLTPACRNLILLTFCPALFALFSDGLKPNIETSFGNVSNTVWHVVEASAQLGPVTQSLSELVMAINVSGITDILDKFNAFVFGLLNVHSLDGWVAYIKTRESVLKKHYSEHSFMLLDSAGGNSHRSLFDTLLASLEPLSILPFNLQALVHNTNRMKTADKKLLEDLENETRRVPERLSLQRPMSTIDTSFIMEHEDNSRKRWSDVPPSYFKHNAYDHLISDVEYCDSLENDNTVKENKWEAMAGHEQVNTQPPAVHTKSKIPRPVTSPIKPESNAISPSIQKPKRSIPVPIRKSPSGTTNGIASKKPGSVVAKPVVTTRPNTANSRTSRVDMKVEPKHSVRPTSLPYKSSNNELKDISKPSISRRTASSSQLRSNKTKTNKKNRTCKTTCHRMTSDAGHLSFNEGETLQLILEVDAKWLLCCRVEQKGLVPRASVIILSDTSHR